jgi:hypothetical protein
MASILQVTLKWSGFQGAPGYSNFYYMSTGDFQPSQATVDAAANATQNLGAYIRTFLPVETSVQVQSDVVELWDTNGVMQNIWSAGSRPVLQGEAPSAPYSAASGAVINWRTAGVRNGRRVRGRTFVVPLANSAYQSDGTLSASVITSLNTNLSTMLDTQPTATLGVWSRPSAKGATDGSWHAVQGFNIPDKVAVLRSRRD